jgi:hypothetical protein
MSTTVGHEPRFVPIEVLLADQRVPLPRRHVEPRVECSAELPGATEFRGT